jgi:hypothetical protein
VLLRLSEEQKRGCIYQLMGSLLLMAFAYEGYLNFLGRKLFPPWEDFERQMSWHSKTKLLMRISSGSVLTKQKSTGSDRGDRQTRSFATAAPAGA